MPVVFCRKYHAVGMGLGLFSELFLLAAGPWAIVSLSQKFWIIWSLGTYRALHAYVRFCSYTCVSVNRKLSQYHLL